MSGCIVFCYRTILVEQASWWKATSLLGFHIQVLNTKYMRNLLPIASTVSYQGIIEGPFQMALLYMYMCMYVHVHFDMTRSCSGHNFRVDQEWTLHYKMRTLCIKGSGLALFAWKQLGRRCK